MVGVKVADIERKGHRERMRKSFLLGGMEYAPDHNLLELYLSLVIPQKDVKPIAYDLINKFGTLENVFNAPVEQLVEVKGVKEVTAVAISLVPFINKRISINKNEHKKALNTSKEAFEYCRNLISLEENETAYLITLNSDLSVINYYKVSDGSVNTTRVDFRKLVTYITKDNASAVIFTHNHPKGSPKPSAHDIDFTLNLRSFLKQIDVVFYDHIIVGANDCYSFQCDKKHSAYLK